MDEQNPILRKLEEIKEALQEGHDKLLLFALGFVLTIIVGILMVVDKLATLVQKMDQLLAKADSQKDSLEDKDSRSALARLTGVDALLELFQPVFIRDAGTDLIVSLDTGGRSVVEVWVKSEAAADFAVYNSCDGENWRYVDTISLADAGKQARGYFNAYRWVRVVANTSSHSEIEITACR